MKHIQKRYAFFKKGGAEAGGGAASELDMSTLQELSKTKETRKLTEAHKADINALLKKALEADTSKDGKLDREEFTSLILKAEGTNRYIAVLREILKHPDNSPIDIEKMRIELGLVEGQQKVKKKTRIDIKKHKNDVGAVVDQKKSVNKITEKAPTNNNTLSAELLAKLSGTEKITNDEHSQITRFLTEAWTMIGKGKHITKGDGFISHAEMASIKKENETAHKHIVAILERLDLILPLTRKGLAVEEITTGLAGIREAKSMIPPTNTKEIPKVTEKNPVITKKAEAKESTDTLVFNRTLYRGCSAGKDVVALQVLLKKVGFLSNNVKTSSNFGPQTERAIKAAQMKFFGEADLIVGSGTLTRLLKEAGIGGSISEDFKQLTSTDRRIIAKRFSNGGEKKKIANRTERTKRRQKAPKPVGNWENAPTAESQIQPTSSKNRESLFGDNSISFGNIANPFKDFFGGISRVFGGSESINSSKFSSLSQLDNHINAKSGLGKLEVSIHNIRRTQSARQVTRVHTLALKMLNRKIPASLYNTIAGAKTTLEKAYTLLYIQNALMGGAKSVERIQNYASVSEFISADRRQAKSADAALRASGFSSTVVSDIHRARNLSYNGAKSIGKYEQYHWEAGENRYLFSLRSKSNLSAGLQAFAGHSVEVVRTGSTIVLSRSVQRQARGVLADNLDITQVAEINAKLGKKYSKAKIASMIKSGKLPSTVEFHKSANCFNDALALNIKFPRRVRDRNYGEGNGGGGGNVGGGQSSAPGKSGGGNNGGGGTGGTGGAGRP